jgi:cysteinyl-tRNA synthetase
MSRRYLGPAFDIHGGGLDLRFPHHENELAQSTAAGDAFASYWVHNGLVVVEGQKMSKSLGNSIYASEFLKLASRPVVARYFLASAHYRSTIDYHVGSLEEAEAAYDRIESFIERADEFLILNNVVVAEDYEVGSLPVPEEFALAMDDDLNVPQALAVLHETVGRGNVLLEGSPSREGVDDILTLVLGMVHVLGIHKSAPGWEQSTAIDWGTVFDGLRSDLYVKLADRLLADRESARASKDFAESDRIRDIFAEIGVTIEDTASGPKRSI